MLVPAAPPFSCTFALKSITSDGPCCCTVTLNCTVTKDARSARVRRALRSKRSPPLQSPRAAASRGAWFRGAWPRKGGGEDPRAAG